MVSVGFLPMMPSSVWYSSCRSDSLTAIFPPFQRSDKRGRAREYREGPT